MFFLVLYVIAFFFSLALFSGEYRKKKRRGEAYKKDGMYGFYLSMTIVWLCLIVSAGARYIG
ncbi:hypothetical protein [Alteribacter natronophilus]|uniref:hypothetical protein n=1 Tax=Alteribacter natronophilus TaxID=2583810 RepID=UPI00110E2C8E|nr:hypothetical protein [Alteribacter natronophilus]TMW72761.1 hypothetical protein FGB90_00155 [Alteribacter natronophilus]